MCPFAKNKCIVDFLAALSFSQVSMQPVVFINVYKIHLVLIQQRMV